MENDNIKRKKPFSFLAAFEKELDITDEGITLPEKIQYIREKLTRLGSKNFVKICEDLREVGVSFKLKYPIEINNKWKFADIFIPDLDAVILYVNDKTTYEGSCERSLRRAPFFERKYHVLIIRDSEAEKAMDMYNEFCSRLKK